METIKSLTECHLNAPYKEFLNPFGDLVYSSFCIKNRDDYELKGVYFYCVKDEIKYFDNIDEALRLKEILWLYKKTRS